MTAAPARRYVLQAGLWIILYFLPYLLAFRGQSNLNSIFERSGDFTHLISFLFLIAFSYLNYFWIIPKFYLKRKYIVYLLLLILCFVVVISVPRFLEPPGPPISPGQFDRSAAAPLPGDPQPILFGMNYNIILFLISTFTCLTIRHRVQLLQIEKQKLDAEVSFLKAQINPHFLFNTLNSIYSLAVEKSDDTPQAIVQLSELMRYILKDSGADRVELSKELQYIRNYIALQKGRLGDTVEISCTLPEAGGNYKIVPLLLMSFVENAFKHGVNPEENAAISIAVSIENSKLHLFVSNNKVTSVQEPEAIGIGLANTTARLDYLYSGKHVLKIDDNETSFIVHLTIDLA